MRPVITHVGLLTRPRMGNSTSTSPTSFPYHTSSGQSRRRTTRHMSPQRAGGGGANEPEKSNAKECKERGNKLYQAQRFDEAVQAYTAAIMRDNTDPTYFTNRALCYVQQKKWAQTEQDCRRALELDSKNVKANYLLGKACVYFQRYDEAIKVLMRANENALTQKLSYGDDITYVLRQALRERFRIEEDKRISQEIELQSYLNDLIDKDIERKISDVKEKSNDELVVAKTEEDARHFGAASKELLNNLFAQIDDRRRRREIPDYLCGKISFELLKDPVITPSGITYDRADIKEHIHRVGHFDPITRVPLNVEQLIPNLAMKEVLDTFITENQWALDA